MTRGGSIETGVGVNLKPETWNFELPFSPRWGEKGIKEEGLFSLIRFPRVPRRAAVRPRRSTRGYIPSPLYEAGFVKGRPSTSSTFYPGFRGLAHGLVRRWAGVAVLFNLYDDAHSVGQGQRPRWGENGSSKFQVSSSRQTPPAFRPFPTPNSRIPTSRLRHDCQNGSPRPRNPNPTSLCVAWPWYTAGWGGESPEIRDSARSPRSPTPPGEADRRCP